MAKRTEAEDEAVSKSAAAGEDRGWSPYADLIYCDVTPHCSCRQTEEVTL